jgi:hypothetical protein
MAQAVGELGEIALEIGEIEHLRRETGVKGDRTSRGEADRLRSPSGTRARNA